MAFDESVEDHPPLPSVRIVLRVDDDLVSMPGLDRSEKPPFPQPPHGHIARSRSRRPLLVPLREQSILPPQRAARAERPVEHDPVEPRGQERLAPVVVPLDNANPVQDAAEAVVNHPPLPGSGPVGRHAVVDQRHAVFVLRRERFRPDQRSIDQLLPLVAVHVGPGDVMRRCQLVHRHRFPRLSRIAFVPQQPDESGAPGRHHVECALDRQFRDSISIEVASGHIDQPTHAFGQHVSLPAGVLVPGKLRQARGQPDDVGAPILVEVRHDHRVTARYLRFDDVRAELGRPGRLFGRSRARARNDRAQQHQQHELLCSSDFVVCLLIRLWR